MEPKVGSERFLHEPTIRLRERWVSLSREEQIQAFEDLSRSDADDFFLCLKSREQSELLQSIPEGERRIWVRLLPPDDLADLVQESPGEFHHIILGDLEIPTRSEVMALLAYSEDVAGGLMNPRFVRVRPEMKVDESIRYLRKQAPYAETTRYLYVLDHDQHLLGVASLRTLFGADGQQLVSDIMRRTVITATENMSQADTRHLFSKSGLMAIPVVNSTGQMKGIVTVDDIVDVVEGEATEDIQKLGGSEALSAPYLQIGLPEMIKKRAGWLVVLFVGELFTATAMAYYQTEIERAVVLALFIPLIISSGGNSGSQASTLVVRAIALREVRLVDWWRVLSRELIVGTALGAILGSLGLMRIMLWPTRTEVYGEHFALVGLTVATSLIGIVLWGSLAGSMLPFILKKFKIDPATASAPMVATLVDVSGLVIYFGLASLILRGTLL